MTNANHSTGDKRLLRQVSERLGLPLPKLVANGQLPSQIATQMEQNCTSCAASAKCQTLLTTRPGPIKSPPGFCSNGRLLAFLTKVFPPKI